MGQILSLLVALASVAGSIMKIFETRRQRQDATNEIKADIAQKEVKASHAVAEVLAEHRPDDDGSNRLRDGKF